MALASLLRLNYKPKRFLSEGFHQRCRPKPLLPRHLFLMIFCDQISHYYLTSAFQKLKLLMRKLYPVFITLFLFISAGTAYVYFPKNEHPNRVPFIVATSEEEHEGKDKDDEEKDKYDGPEARMQQ